MCARRQKLFATPKTAGDGNARFQMRSDALNCDDSFLSAIDDDSNLHNPPWLSSGKRLPELRLYSAMRARPLSNERGTRSRRAVEQKGCIGGFNLYQLQGYSSRGPARSARFHSAERVGERPGPAPVHDGCGSKASEKSRDLLESVLWDRQDIRPFNSLEWLPYPSLCTHGNGTCPRYRQ